MKIRTSIMKFYVVSERKLVVGWSPKCACTAVCDWLVNGVIGTKSGEIAQRGIRIREYLRSKGYVKSPHDAIQFIKREGFVPVLFVRNPFERIASAYIDKFLCRGGKPITYPNGFENFARHAIEEIYQLRHHVGEYEGVSFVDLLKYIEFNVSRGRNINDHWSPQIGGLTDELRDILAGSRFLVRQESFEHDLRNINSALAISYIPGERNVSRMPSRWFHPDGQQDYSRMPNKSLVENHLAITKANLLTAETKSLIRNIYRDDFDVLGYATGTPEVKAFGDLVRPSEARAKARVKGGRVRRADKLKGLKRPSEAHNVASSTTTPNVL